MTEEDHNSIGWYRVPWYFPPECEGNFPARRSKLKRIQRKLKQKQQQQQHQQPNGNQHQQPNGSQHNQHPGHQHNRETVEPKDQQHESASPQISPQQASKPAASSWADLVKKQQQKESEHNQRAAQQHLANGQSSPPQSQELANGHSENQDSSSSSSNTPSNSNNNDGQEEAAAFSPLPTTATLQRKPLGRVLKDYRQQDGPHKLIARGLVNTGNICFMNSILQVLVHCSPFYHLLDFVSKNAAFSLKSDTPIVDGLVELLTEVERVQLSSSGKALAASPITPDSFYSIISQHKNFAHLERGRQEDAEEFLGYLLEAVHEEFANALGLEGESTTSGSTISTKTEDTADWTEVGKGSKPVVARHSGMSVDTPISRLFGGKFRSTLTVPGGKSPSITVDPFQHVQLDIDDSAVSTIEDAFRFMSRPEQIPYKLHTHSMVEKTVVFDQLPPVLIVHLKRFTFEHHSGSQKNSKPVGFGPRLEIPAQCFTAAKADVINKRYRLFAVVYHHGPSAAAGHYTVDVQAADDGEKWIHIDDIALRQVDKVGTPEDASKTAYLLFYVREADSVV